MFRRRQREAQPYSAWIDDLVTERKQERHRWFTLRKEDSATMRRIQAASREEQRAFVLAAIEWLDLRHKKRSAAYYETWAVRQAMQTVLRHRLPFEHDDVCRLLDWSIEEPNAFVQGTSQMVKVLQDYLKEHELTPALKERVRKLTKDLDEGYSTAETRRWSARLKELGGLMISSLPLIPGEAWSDAALAEIEAMEGEEREAWIALLQLCARAGGARPGVKWSGDANALLEKVGRRSFESAIMRWFPLVERPRTTPVDERRIQWLPDPNLLIVDKNADILKGLVWLCAGREDAEVARALTALALSAYRKVPQLGPRCVRVGNACVWALGNMPGTEGIGQLALLKVRVKFGTAQKGIEKALNIAAERAGMPLEEIEEISVPAYGLQEVGVRRERVGEFGVELVVTGTSATELRWIKPDGKRQKSVPKALKEGHPEDLKELRAAASDLRKMLPAQRDRIENLYLEQKSWAYPMWRERYLDHPLVGTLARRLIWRFTNSERTAAGVFHEGRILGRNGHALDWPDDSTLVELWHPMQEKPNEVLAWRDWLAELEIRQPFKQAHREVYLLTEAERTTRTYSNRFAAHVLKQHQFNALCAARSWKNKLRLMVDDEYPPASRDMPAWGLRAEFWVEGLGDNYGADTTEAGTYLYLVTDQVRFYHIDARENYAHAGGGGYSPGWNGGALSDPLVLDEIPPLVFSEIMRGVDMFVGVASVGNDPNWSDGGPEGRYRDHWTSYSFGALSETAKTRKQVLQRLIPRLKIADRCRLKDRFLVVQGDMRTYKIHLGSGNILMEPNDQYLCIVPTQNPAAGGLGTKLFLPFEGDRTLAIILSKAFLLAQDTNIKDPTILHQISS